MTRALGVSPRLPVRDLARTIDFYVGVLGFTAGPPFPQESPTFVILARDDATLQFYVPETGGPCGHGTICLEVDDALDVHRAVKDRVAIDWGPEVYWYGRREFAFKDPDGYGVIVTQATDEPPDCEDEDT